MAGDGGRWPTFAAFASRRIEIECLACSSSASFSSLNVSRQCSASRRAWLGVAMRIFLLVDFGAWPAPRTSSRAREDWRQKGWDARGGKGR